VIPVNVGRYERLVRRLLGVRGSVSGAVTADEILRLYLCLDFKHLDWEFLLGEMVEAVGIDNPAPQAGLLSYVGVKNPVDSNRLCTLRRLEYVNTGPAADQARWILCPVSSLTLGPGGTDTLAFAAVDTRWADERSGMVITQGAQAAFPTNGKVIQIGMSNGAGTKLVSEMGDEAGVAVLSPGFACVLQEATANVIVRGNLRWSSRPLEEDEERPGT
jgi:hypothetical protein